MESVYLEPIKCQQCNQPMEDKGQDIFFYCDFCHKGYEIRDQKLHPVDVQFKICQGVKEARGKTLPFWAFKSNLTIFYRETKITAMSVLSALGDILLGKGEDKKKERIFYIPAYRDEQGKNISIGFHLTVKQPPLKNGDVWNFERVFYDSIDAAKLADFIFLSYEIEKPDVVSRIKYRLDLYSPSLMVIKFT